MHCAVKFTAKILQSSNDDSVTCADVPISACHYQTALMHISNFSMATLLVGYRWCDNLFSTTMLYYTVHQKV